MSKSLYSLRMHANRGQEHVSGAERLLEFEQLVETASAMLQRALKHPRGAAERISLKVESFGDAAVRREALLPLSTHAVDDWRQGRELAAELLVRHGIARRVVTTALAALAAGAAPGGTVMRGAMLVDSASGRRLEPDPARGVRVSRMDLDLAARHAVESLLGGQGLNNPRVIEAWVLASKVALYPQVIAELCWSDDPDYLTGYVASARHGYQRITRLKAAGDRIGGRIFFVAAATLPAELIDALQLEPILFSAPRPNTLEQGLCAN